MKAELHPNLFAGRYTALETVARGGEGRVLRARDTRNGDEVAIKLRPSRTELWERERSLLERLKPHGGLPVVRDAFTIEGTWALVTTWMQGRSLARILDEEGDPGLGYDRALGVLEEAASILDHLHGHDPPVVHGDVKPANLIQQPDARIALVDFGASVAAVGGTRGFVDPEVYRTGRLTPAADVYSLAATAFALLSGLPPRIGVRAHWTGIDPKLVGRLDAGLRKGMAADPAQRPASAGALVELLRRKPSGRVNVIRAIPPTYASTFVGRGPEMRELRRTLGTARLVTVTGAGGMGKTRLAVEAARRLPGSCFVEVRASTGSETLAEDVLHAVDGPALHGRSPVEALVEHLAHRRMLLVLDACERSANVPALLHTLLSRSAGVKVLATSRAPLRVPGERVLRLGPLPFVGSRSPALRLIRARAAANRRSLRPGEAAEMSRRTAGVPLAIEMAASHADVPRSHDEPGVDVIGQSLGRLPSDEAHVLQRLSVFISGATVEAARALCGTDAVPPEAVLGHLWSLVDRGLVTVEGSGDAIRYRPPDVVRDIVWAKLASRHELAVARDDHVAWCADLLSEGHRYIRGPDQATWVGRLGSEEEEVTQAIQWAVQTDPETAISMSAHYGRVWVLRGRWASGLALCREAIEAAGGRRPPALCVCLATAGTLAKRLGHAELAEAFLDRSVEIAEEAGDPAAIVESLLARAEAALPGTGPLVDQHRRVLELARRIGHVEAEAVALEWLGRLEFRRGDAGTAATMLGRALANRIRTGDPNRLSNLISHLGDLTLMRFGEPDRARDLYTHSRRIVAAIGNSPAVADRDLWLAGVALWTGDLEEAAKLYTSSRTTFRRLGGAFGVLTASLGLAEIASRQGEPRRARRCLAGAVDAAVAAGAAHFVTRHGRVSAAVSRRAGNPKRALGPLSRSLRLHVENPAEGFVHDQVACIEEAARVLAALGHGGAVWCAGAAEHLRDTHRAPRPWVEEIEHTTMRAMIGTDVPDVSVSLDAGIARSAAIVADVSDLSLRPRGRLAE